jgi:hypothetical protein
MVSLFFRDGTYTPQGSTKLSTHQREKIEKGCVLSCELRRGARISPLFSLEDNNLARKIHSKKESLAINGAEPSHKRTQDLQIFTILRQVVTLRGLKGHRHPGKTFIVQQVFETIQPDFSFADMLMAINPAAQLFL